MPACLSCKPLDICRREGLRLLRAGGKRQKEEGRGQKEEGRGQKEEGKGLVGAIKLLTVALRFAQFLISVFWGMTT
jgi:hypothetical protein